MKGLIGKKVGMTQIFSEAGEAIPVTVIEAGPAVVTQIKTVETDVKYAGYIKRELAEVERQKQLENKFIPEDMDYRKIKGLRLEAGQKLAQFRPATVGQASRISGVSPADVSVLLMYLGIK